MSSIQHRPVSSSVSPEAATRPLLDLVSRFINRLEDGAGPGRKIISAGLAPKGEEREILEARKWHLLASLTPPMGEEDRRMLTKVVAALLGSFPTYGADREDARASVALICRALDDVPVWSVQQAAQHFIKGCTKIPWNNDRAPTPPQIRSEAKLICLDVETELHRLSQVLDAELVDNTTTQDERDAALAKWAEIRAGIVGSNVLRERSDQEVNREREAQIRANRLVRARERGVSPELAQQIQAGHEPFDACSRENVQ